MQHMYIPAAGPADVLGTRYHGGGVAESTDWYTLSTHTGQVFWNSFYAVSCMQRKSLNFFSVDVIYIFETIHR